MRILLFRPEADAERSARAIVDRGHEPILAPLFTVARSSEPPPDGAFDALVLTSGNAVESLAAGPESWRALPVFAVGDRTAEKIRDAGFPDARSAGGDRDDLVALIRGHLSAPARLLLVVGRDRREDVPRMLAELGFATQIWAAYAAEAVSTLPVAAAQAIAEGGADAALHYSARGAQTFLDLTRAVHLADEALALTHVALSAEVAAPLIAAGAATVLVAEHPEEAALMAALTQVSERPPREATPEAEPEAAPAEGRRRGARARRTPPTIEGVATTPDATETAAQAVLPTEALPREFDPPEPAPAPVPADEAARLVEGPDAAMPPPPAPPEPPAQARTAERNEARPLLPALALAALAGGVVGAGLVLLALQFATPSASVAQVAELRGRLDDLQGANAALESKLAAATAAAGAATTAAGAAATEAKAAMAAAEKAGGEAQGARTQAAQAAQVAGSRPAGLDPQALAGVTAQAQRTEAATAALGQRLDQAATRIGSVESLAKTAAEPSPQALAAARVVLAERVRQALASGQPFAADVAALGKGGAASGELAALNAVAAAGAATQEALLAQAKDHRLAFERALVPADAGWQERLAGLASRVVSIRPVGESGDTNPATLPARLETALDRGQIDGAAKLWAQLPEPARRESAAFGEALGKRAAADAAIAKIAQDAVAALGTAG